MTLRPFFRTSARLEYDEAAEAERDEDKLEEDVEGEERRGTIEEEIGGPESRDHDEKRRQSTPKTRTEQTATPPDPGRGTPSKETAMLPDPLHPALVHFPIVLAVLAPLLAAGFLWAIHTSRLPARAWLAVVVLQAVIVGAGWLTAETGEEQEERVERVVRETTIEEHAASLARAPSSPPSPSPGSAIPAASSSTSTLRPWPTSTARRSPRPWAAGR